MKNNILIYLAVLLTVTLPTVMFAQSEQRGIVLEYDNIKHVKTPLANVEVVISDAGSTISDENGEFRLSFRQLQPGDKIKVRRILKAGYELLNPEIVEQWYITREDTPFEIVLVKTEKLAEARYQMTQHGFHEAEKEYELLQKKIRRDYQHKHITEEEYKQRLHKLELDYEQKLDDIDNYIERFVRIDRTELSEKGKKAFELVAQGKFAEAISTLEGENLVEQFIQQQVNVHKLTSDEETIEEAQKKLLNQQKQLLRVINQEVELLKIQGGKESFDRIDHILNEMAYADTTNFSMMFRYGRHLRDQGKYEQALKVYEDLAERSHNKCDTLCELRAQMFRGVILGKMDEHEQCIEVLRDVTPKLELFNRTLPDTVRFLDDIAYGYHNLGYLLALHNQHTEGRLYLHKSLYMIYRIHVNGKAPSRTYRHQYAMMLVKTAAVLRNSTWLNECLSALQEASPIIDKLYHDKPHQYSFSMAYAWCCKGLVYYTLGDSYRDDTENAYLMSLSYYREAVDRNPEAYTGEMAKCMLYLGIFYYTHHESKKAMEFLEQCLKIFETEAGDGESFAHELSETYLYLGSCYYFQKQYEQTLQMNLKMLEITEPQYKKDPDGYRDLMSLCLRHLANVYIALGNKEEAMKYARRAMVIDPKQHENRRILTKLENALKNPGLPIIEKRNE